MWTSLRRLVVATALLASPALALTQQAESERPALLRLSASRDALAALQRDLRLDVAAVRGDEVHVVADAADRAALTARGVPFALEIPDLRAHYASRLLQGAALAAQPLPRQGEWLVPPFGQGSLGGYYTYAEVVSVLDQMRAQHPDLVSAKIAIGTSVEGRTLWAVKISDNPDLDEPEPEARFDAMHHAREPMSMQALLWFALFLLEGYGSDADATYLVNERELWLVPVVNPDGYVYNQLTDPAGGGLWRKNRRDNGDGTFGVDPNRNYPFQWGCDDEGSSPITDDETYRGSSPASEPEVAAMVAFISAHDFRTALSIHSYSNLWLMPYGYAPEYPFNMLLYLELGQIYTQRNGYPLGLASEVLYLANGVTIDYDDAVHGTLSASPEIGSWEDGFWPATERILPLAEENLPGLKATALAAGAWVRPGATQLLDDGDGDGVFEAGEQVGVVLSLRNSGSVPTDGDVHVALACSAAGVTVLDGEHQHSAQAEFVDVDNAAEPMRLALVGVVPGQSVDFELAITYEGWTQVVPGSFTVQSAPCTPSWRPTLGLPPHGVDGWIAALARFDDGSGEALYAAGDFTTAGGFAAQNVARWNGATWSPVGSGMNSGVGALAVFDDGSGRQLYAAGDFSVAGGVSTIGIARWDGLAWSALGGGFNDSADAMTVFDDGAGGGPALYVGGAFTKAGGANIARIARWDGLSWSALGTGVGAGQVDALAAFDDGGGAGPQLYAAGRFTTAGGSEAHNIARWDGASWWPVGELGPNYDVYALAVHDDGSVPALYAGGIFTLADWWPAVNIARWDGARWSAVGGGTDNTIVTLASVGSTLYAGGFFRTAGGVVANRVAAWDGETWSALGGGLKPLQAGSGVVTPLADSGGEVRLAVGGEFTGAGHLPATGLAEWGCGSALAWKDLGAGLAGTQGVPALVGTGTLEGDEPAALMLTDAASSASSVLFVAPGSMPQPFKGGTLVALPVALLLPFQTLGNGTVPLAFTWPPGIPPATSIWFQYAIADGAAVHDVALSNALKATTP